MIKTLSDKCTNVIMRYAESSMLNKNVVSFGIELIISSLIGVFIAIVLSLLFKMPLAWIVFFSSFVPIRTTAGGFHSSTHTRCNIVFTIAFLVCITISKYLIIPVYASVLLLSLSVITTLILSPVESKNKPLSTKRRKENGLASIIIILVDVLISLTVFLSDNNDSTFQMFMMGIYVASISQIAAFIVNSKERRISR